MNDSSQSAGERAELRGFCTRCCAAGTVPAQGSVVPALVFGARASAHPAALLRAREYWGQTPGSSWTPFEDLTPSYCSHPWHYLKWLFQGEGTVFWCCQGCCLPGGGIKRKRENPRKQRRYERVPEAPWQFSSVPAHSTTPGGGAVARPVEQAGGSTCVMSELHAGERRAIGALRGHGDAHNSSTDI